METIIRPFKKKDLAEQQLHHFVFDFDPRADAIPKRLDPLQVIDFVQRQLRSEAVHAVEASQIAKLADFYDLKPLVPAFLAALDQPEATEDRYSLALAYTTAIGILAEGQSWEKGRDRYHLLLTSRYSRYRIPELLQCWNEYTPTEDDKAMVNFMQTLERDLQKQAEKDSSAGIELRKLQDLRNNDLPRVVKAAGVKQEILGIEPVAARLDRLTSIYLRLSMQYHQWLDRWAVRMILREYYRNGPVEPIAAFRRAAEKVQASSLSDEEKRVRKLSCWLAIDFFGGPLDESERQATRGLQPPSGGLLSLVE